jgi:hypothetical protein
MMNRKPLFALGAAALCATLLVTPASAGPHGATGSGHATAPSMSAGAGTHSWGSHSWGGHSPGFASRSGGLASNNSSNAWRGASHGFAHDFDRGRHHGHHDRGFGVGVFGAPGFAYDYPYAYSDDDSAYVDPGCTQLRHVMTPWGWQWQRVWVCN